MKKIYVVSSLLLSLGVVLANGCGDGSTTTETASTTTEPTGAEPAGAGTPGAEPAGAGTPGAEPAGAGTPGAEPAGTGSEAALEAAPSKDAVTAKVDDKTDMLKGQVSSADGYMALKYGPRDPKNKDVTKLFIVKDGKAVFGLAADVHGSEKKGNNLPVDVKKLLPKEFKVGEVVSVSKEGNNYFAVLISDKKPRMGFADASAVWLISTNGTSFSQVVDAKKKPVTDMKALAKLGYAVAAE